jgi:hypothetical protein
MLRIDLALKTEPPDERIRTLLRYAAEREQSRLPKSSAHVPRGSSCASRPRGHLLHYLQRA